MSGWFDKTIDIISWSQVLLGPYIFFPQSTAFFWLFLRSIFERNFFHGGRRSECQRNGLQLFDLRSERRNRTRRSRGRVRCWTGNSAVDGNERTVGGCISRKVNNEIVREVSSKVVGEANGKVVREATDEVVREVNGEVVREVTYKIVREVNDKVVRAVNDKVAEEVRREHTRGASLANQAVHNKPKVEAVFGSGREGKQHEQQTVSKAQHDQRKIRGSESPSEYGNLLSSVAFPMDMRVVGTMIVKMVRVALF